MTDEQKFRVELFTKLTEKLKLTPTRLKDFAEVDARTPNRWKAGEGIVPTPLLMLLALMYRKRVTPEQMRKLVGLSPLPPLRGRGRPKEGDQ